MRLFFVGEFWSERKSARWAISRSGSLLVKAREAAAARETRFVGDEDIAQSVSEERQ